MMITIVIIKAPKTETRKLRRDAEKKGRRMLVDAKVYYKMKIISWTSLWFLQDGDHLLEWVLMGFDYECMLTSQTHPKTLTKILLAISSIEWWGLTLYKLPFCGKKWGWDNHSVVKSGFEKALRFFVEDIIIGKKMYGLATCKNWETFFINCGWNWKERVTG